MRIRSITAIAALATAALTVTALATTANAASTPWDHDGGLVFTGDGAQLPTTPRDVWSALDGRTITELGSGGAGRHACVIDAAGEAVCIGYTGRGQLGIGTKYSTSSAAAVTTDGVLAGKTLTDITMGNEHTCALDSAGLAYCWGSSTKGQLGSGTTRRSNYAPTKVNTTGVLNGKTLTSISAGGNHTCAVATDGKAYCWGLNTNGQLGDGTRHDRARPVAVDASGALAGRDLVAIDAGTAHTCAVDSVGAAFCWGSGGQGRLGDGLAQRAKTPVKVSGTGTQLPIAQISAGGSHTCAIADIGDVYCWGYNDHGQLGVGDTRRRLTPTLTLENFGVRDVTTGFAHTCLVTANRAIMCFGANDSGQLGDGTRHDATTPITALAGDMAGENADQVVATSNGTCSLSLQGGVYCWGPRDQYLPGDTAYALTPTRVASDPTALEGKTLTQLTDDAVHHCALTAAGKAFCWGYGSQGQLGNGVFNGATRPTPVDTSGALNGVKLTDITAGEYHTCALSDAGAAYCWGSNDGGQLGDGTDTSRKVPRPVDTSGVLAGKTLVDITAGDVFTCAIDTLGAAYCWGSGYQGQLGNGKFNAPWTPVAVSTSGVLAGKTLVAIDAGYDHACALDSDGAAYCWGSNVYGDLGNGGTTASNVPTAVDASGVLSGKSLVDISAGDSATCAVSDAGKVYCWGDGITGQLGDGTTDSPATTPRAVDTSGALSGVTVESVSVGGLAACALSAAGSVYCWGSNYSGQLGDGTFTSRTRPVAVYTAGALTGAKVTQVATSTQTWMLTQQG